MVRLTAAARPKSAAPPRSNFVLPETDGRVETVVTVVATTGALGGADSMESANPTGTTNAATSSANSRTRYRFLNNPMANGKTASDMPRQAT